MIESLYGFLVLFLLAFIGIPLGYALLLVGFAGFAILRGLSPAFAMVGQQVVEYSTNYGFSVLPLFILMGAFVHRAQLSEDLYDAANAWLGHRRGGLAVATIASCGAFSAVSGSSLATASMMTKVALPSMRRFKYDDRLATGSVAAGGTLGILIPPSVPLVIFGILTQTDIGKLFIAGAVPGLLLALAFVAAIWVVTFLSPAMGPRGERVSLGRRLRALRSVWALLVLFFVVLGGIYFGVFTPTEAAGIGATGAFLFALARKRLSWREFVASLVEAGVMTAMIFIVVFGAMVFSNFVNYAGLTRGLVTMINDWSLSPFWLVVAICAIYLVLGCVFDSIAMLLLTAPIFAAILEPLGVSMIWFGIVTIVAIEIGLITPPMGMNVFTVKAVAKDVDLSVIFKGVAPFIVASLVTLILLILFPAISLTLPALM